MRLIKSLSKKKGLAPGSLVHIGEVKNKAVSMSKITYNQGSYLIESPRNNVFYEKT